MSDATEARYNPRGLRCEVGGDRGKMKSSYSSARTQSRPEFKSRINHGCFSTDGGEQAFAMTVPVYTGVVLIVSPPPPPAPSLGLLQPAYVPHSVGTAERGNSLLRFGRRVHIRPYLSSREQPHFKTPGGVLDDRAGG